MSEWQPSAEDIDEANRMFLAMDVINEGASRFARTLMETDPGFARSLMDSIEREFALLGADDVPIADAA